MVSLSSPDPDQPQVAGESQRSPEGTMADVNQRAFRDGYEPAAGDVFIAVLGVTGAGKSTFISKCSGKQVAIGHNLQACTQEVSVYLCKSRDFNIYLVDTPGFDDTNRSDTEVLREIASWLTASYANSIKLHGIIYLHRITDPRMQGLGMRNLHMFKRLCGDQNLSNVIMATNQWERVSLEDGIERERQLKETKNFWGYMVERGSQVHRHYNTRESCLNLIDSLVGDTKSRPKIVLDIQAQMVDEGKEFAETGAGRAVNRAISQERERFAKQIAESQADMEEALASHDRETADMLKQYQEEMNERVRRLDSEHSALQVSLERLQEERFAKVKKALKDAERVNAEAKEMMETTRREQERRQKILEDQIRAKDDAAAKERQEMAKLQAKVYTLYLPKAAPEEKYAIALFTFDGEIDGDLPLKKDDRVLVLKHSARSDEWWTGKLGNLTGIFPANYVEWETDRMLRDPKAVQEPEPEQKPKLEHKAKTVSANKLRKRSPLGINPTHTESRQRAQSTIFTERTPIMPGDFAGEVPASGSLIESSAESGDSSDLEDTHEMPPRCERSHPRERARERVGCVLKDGKAMPFSLRGRRPIPERISTDPADSRHHSREPPRTEPHSFSSDCIDSDCSVRPLGSKRPTHQRLSTREELSSHLYGRVDGSKQYYDTREEAGYEASRLVQQQRETGANESECDVSDPNVVNQAYQERIRSVLRNQLISERGYEIKSVERVARELSWTPVHLFSFSENVALSVIDHVQGYVEDIMGEAWNWWPLAPRQHRLRAGFYRLGWNLPCGKARHLDIPNHVRSAVENTFTSAPSFLRDTSQSHVDSRVVGAPSMSGALHTTSSTAPPSGLQIAAAAAVSPSSSHGNSIQLHSTQASTPPVSSTFHSPVPAPGLCQPVLYVYLCVESSSRQFVGLNCSSVQTDVEFFAKIRSGYDAARGRLRLYFSTWCYDHCDFFQFQKTGIGLGARLKIAFPDPTDTLYEYDPRPPKELPPDGPISHDEFREHYYYEICPSLLSWERWHRQQTGLSSVEEEALKAVPKRVVKLDMQNGKREHFYGLYAKEARSAARVALHLTLCNVPGVIFFFLWLFQWRHGSDLQGAAVPVQLSLSLTAGYLGVLYWAR